MRRRGLVLFLVLCSIPMTHIVVRDVLLRCAFCVCLFSIEPLCFEFPLSVCVSGSHYVCAHGAMVVDSLWLLGAEHVCVVPGYFLVLREVFVSAL